MKFCGSWVVWICHRDASASIKPLMIGCLLCEAFAVIKLGAPLYSSWEGHYVEEEACSFGKMFQPCHLSADRVAVVRMIMWPYRWTVNNSSNYINSWNKYRDNWTHSNKFLKVRKYIFVRMCFKNSVLQTVLRLSSLNMLNNFCQLLFSHRKK